MGGDPLGCSHAFHFVLCRDDNRRGYRGGYLLVKSAGHEFLRQSACTACGLIGRSIVSAIRL